MDIFILCMRMYDSAEHYKRKSFFFPVEGLKGVGLLELDLQAQPTGSNPKISIFEI